MVNNYTHALQGVCCGITVGHEILLNSLKSPLSVYIYCTYSGGFKFLHATHVKWNVGPWLTSRLAVIEQMQCEIKGEQQETSPIQQTSVKTNSALMKLKHNSEVAIRKTRVWLEGTWKDSQPWSSHLCSTHTYCLNNLDIVASVIWEWWWCVVTHHKLQKLPSKSCGWCHIHNVFPQTVWPPV